MRICTRGCVGAWARGRVSAWVTCVCVRVGVGVCACVRVWVHGRARRRLRVVRACARTCGLARAHVCVVCITCVCVCCVLCVSIVCVMCVFRASPTLGILEKTSHALSLSIRPK